MKIPFLDLAASIRELRSELDAAHARVLDRGWVLLGPELEQFEREWATYVSARHAIGVANGLDALRLALEAVGVGSGDEVIVPANTYIATWLAVSELRAVPVPVEPDERTANIDPERVEVAITRRTKAIMPVHLYGQTADLDPIISIARRYGLKVVEDAAQCHGARYKGRRIGGHGDIVCWSYYPTKNFGALADAGGLTTDDDRLADKLRIARNYGQRERYVCETKGWNSRMDEWSAAVLRVKLNHLDEWNQRREMLAARYQEQLVDIGLILPWTQSGCGNVHHLYVVRHQDREGLRVAMAAVGVGTIVHYPIPPHRQSAYADLGIPMGVLPITERIHATCISLPLHPHLAVDDQQRIIDAVRKYLKH